MPILRPGIQEIIAYENGELDEAEAAFLMQVMINCGFAWQMKDAYAQRAMDSIKVGDCMYGPASMREYFGLEVPSRDELEPGTCGTREFVVAQRGEEWAAMLDRASDS